MRVYQRVVFDWRDGRMLDIEVEEGAVGPEVAAPPRADAAKAFEPISPTPATEIQALCWRDEESLFEPLQLREQTDYLLDITVPASRDEAEERCRTSATWPLVERLEKFFHRDPPKRWHTSETSVRITGRLNFRSHVGIADLRIDGRDPLLVEVVPRKLAYHSDFVALLTQVSAEFAALLLQIDAGTAARFGIGSPEHVDPRALLFHLRRLMLSDELPQAVEHVLESGARQVRTAHELVDPSQVESIDPNPIVLAGAEARWQPGGPLARLFRGRTPLSLSEVRRFETGDTLENRYVKAFLEELLVLVNSLERRLREDNLSRAAREAHRWGDEVGEWLAHPLWQEVAALQDVPLNSQLLQKGRGYRDVLAADLTLQLGLQLPWERGAQLVEGLEGEIRPIDELYQYWCFFVLRDALRSVCGDEGIAAGSLLRWSRGRLRVHLRYGQKSRIRFLYRRTGGITAKIALYYNRQFSKRAAEHWYASGSYSADFRPDYSILIAPTDAEKRGEAHWLHFDAKYRLDAAPWNAAFQAGDGRDSEGGVMNAAATGTVAGYRRENLDEMHAYRDAVLGSRGAFILYPGSGASHDAFIRLPMRRYGPATTVIPSVGAFQLNPSLNAAQRQELESFLRSVIQAVTGPKTYQEETALS